MRAPLALGVLVAGEQLRQQELGPLEWWGREDGLTSSAVVGDDQVLVGLQVPATPAGMAEDEAVQVQDEGDAQRLVSIEAGQLIDGVPVAGELPLVAVAEALRALG